MAYIIETCPKCGGELLNISLTCYPPIHKKVCRSCGWSWQDDKIVSVPFNEDNDTATEEQEECCMNCKYWDSYELEKNPNSPCLWADGSCHRYPANVTCVAGMTDAGSFIFEELYKGLPLLDHPVTFGDDWCGEFARR